MKASCKKYFIGNCHHLFFKKLLEKNIIVSWGNIQKKYFLRSFHRLIALHYFLNFLFKISKLSFSLLFSSVNDLFDLVSSDKSLLNFDELLIILGSSNKEGAKLLDGFFRFSFSKFSRIFYLFNAVYYRILFIKNSFSSGGSSIFFSSIVWFLFSRFFILWSWLSKRYWLFSMRLSFLFCPY